METEVTESNQTGDTKAISQIFPVSLMRCFGTVLSFTIVFSCQSNGSPSSQYKIVITVFPRQTLSISRLNSLFRVRHLPLLSLRPCASNTDRTMLKYRQIKYDKVSLYRQCLDQNGYEVPNQISQNRLTPHTNPPTSSAHRCRQTDNPCKPSAGSSLIGRWPALQHRFPVYSYLFSDRLPA